MTFDEVTMTIEATEVTQIKLYKDGDAWCALIGDDIQSGDTGFGSSPSDALRGLARELEIKLCLETIDPNAYRKD